ncbi:MAG TPA: nuclear transport factor 2 family protein [Novosphingobium sp.]|nr:nuclear transport factor 2 family protein [Novosphingobium sp.]HZV09536.1 nuclear transport factor 2 family protein [Novosphingobium sp.]
MSETEWRRLERIVAAQQHELERAQAVTAIQNCMGRYETVHITPAEIGRSGECFALWRADCSVEVSDWGCFFGGEAIDGFWRSMTAPDLRGGIFWHALATPVIQVAGDGRTAKVTWMSPGFETMPPLQAGEEAKSFWCWGKYACDFIRHPETGAWKIWHMKWFRTIRSDFAKSWYEDSRNTLAGMPGPVPYDHANRQPSVFHRPYQFDEVPHPFPIDPEPYATYDGNFRWIYGGAEYEARYGVRHPDYARLYHVNYPNAV